MIVFIGGETLSSAHSARPRKIPRWIVLVRENFSVNKAGGGGATGGLWKKKNWKTQFVLRSMATRFRFYVILKKLKIIEYDF